MAAEYSLSFSVGSVDGTQKQVRCQELLTRGYVGRYLQAFTLHLLPEAVIGLNQSCAESLDLCQLTLHAQGVMVLQRQNCDS